MRSAYAILALAMLAACGEAAPDVSSVDAGAGDAAEQACSASFLPVADLVGNAGSPRGSADPRATELVLYELQARSANACPTPWAMAPWQQSTRRFIRGSS